MTIAKQSRSLNNVLHSREAFEDSQGTRRLIYRARYYDHIAGTSRNREVRDYLL